MPPWQTKITGNFSTLRDGRNRQKDIVATVAGQNNVIRERKVRQLNSATIANPEGDFPPVYISYRNRNNIRIRRHTREVSWDDIEDERRGRENRIEATKIRNSIKTDLRIFFPGKGEYDEILGISHSLYKMPNGHVK
jgi:hypothetical protein